MALGGAAPDHWDAPTSWKCHSREIYSYCGEHVLLQSQSNQLRDKLDGWPHTHKNTHLHTHPNTSIRWSTEQKSHKGNNKHCLHCSCLYMFFISANDSRWNETPDISPASCWSVGCGGECYVNRGICSCRRWNVYCRLEEVHLRRKEKKSIISLRLNVSYMWHLTSYVHTAHSPCTRLPAVCAKPLWLRL